MKDIKETLFKLCKEQRCVLLYASYFGSTLYGTSVEKSDTDVKGLFLPSSTSMLLGKKCQSITYSTGNDTSRNTQGDIDIQLWSIQYFLTTLLAQGDTGALDLLFSPSNAKCVIYKPYYTDLVFNNYEQFVNCENQNAYIGYCIGQAKKYGIKGSRLGVVKQVKEYLDSIQYEDTDRLSTYLDDIMGRFYHPQYCFTKEVNGDIGLVLCNRIHLSKITLKEFYSRITKHYEQYGERARLAMQNEGIDWKALSHAVRCLYQVKELLTTGKIVFPLIKAEELIRIKSGEYSWEQVEQLIVSELETVNSMMAKTMLHKYNMQLAEQIILDLYQKVGN